MIKPHYRRAPGLGRGSLTRLLCYAEANGVSTAHCLQGTSIPADILNSEEDVSALQEKRVIENLIQQLDQPFYHGFMLGMNYHVTDLGMFGLALMSCKNGAHAAQMTKRYLDSAHHFVNMSLQQNGYKLRIIWTLNEAGTDKLQYFLMAREIGICHAIQTYFLKGRKRSVYEIGFMFDYMKGMDDVSSAYCAPVRFNQSQNYLITDASQLSMSTEFTNLVNAQVIEKTFLSQLDTPMVEPRLYEKVKQYLLSGNNLNVSKSDVAQIFHMSERTFTRHLEKENKNWRGILSEVRLKKADELLLRGNASLQTIANEVGFASVSSFSHAFTKYKAMAPSEYRLQYRQLFETHGLPN